MATTTVKLVRKPVKKLNKPIKTVIDIRVKTWRDKYYGNSYHSARIAINNDYDNQIVVPFQCGSFDRYEWLQKLPKLYKLRIAKYTRYDGVVVQGNITQDESILVTQHSEEVTKKECKRFGGKS